MLGNLAINRILWAVTGLMTIVAAILGVLDSGIYTANGMVTTQVVPGCVSQDIMAIGAGALLLVLAAIGGETRFKAHILALGLLTFTFYAYGIYSIERIYNDLYLLYLALCSVSFYGILCHLFSVKGAIVDKLRVPGAIRWAALAFMLLIPIIFYPKWTGELLGFIRAGEKKELTYSIYILDLVFVMPMFLVGIWMIARRRGIGLLLAPVLMIKGFTVLFPLVVGELIKPWFDQATVWSEMYFYLAISAVFLVLAVACMWGLSLAGKRIGEARPSR